MNNIIFQEARSEILSIMDWYSDQSLQCITAMLVLRKTCNMYIFLEPSDRALDRKYHFYYRPNTPLRATEPRSIHVDTAQKDD